MVTVYHTVALTPIFWHIIDPFPTYIMIKSCCYVEAKQRKTKSKKKKSNGSNFKFYLTPAATASCG